MGDISQMPRPPMYHKCEIDLSKFHQICRRGRTSPLARFSVPSPVARPCIQSRPFADRPVRSSDHWTQSATSGFGSV